MTAHLTDQHIVNGMDLGRLEAFRRALYENPVILGLEARSVWEGHSGRSTVHLGPDELAGQRIDRDARRYRVPCGASRQVEEAVGFVGPADRVEPVEMALGAMAACLSNSIALNAPRNGIDLEGMEISVRTDLDPSVLFEVKGPEDHTSCMPLISIDVEVRGDFTDEQIRTIERLIAHSPVHGMVAEANTVESRVRRA